MIKISWHTPYFSVIPVEAELLLPLSLDLKQEGLSVERISPYSIEIASMVNKEIIITDKRTKAEWISLFELSNDPERELFLLDGWEPLKIKTKLKERIDLLINELKAKSLWGDF